MKNKSFHLIALTVLLISLFLPTHSARAATTWEVRSTGDGAPFPANCPGANCRLRDAIAAAAPGDTIQFHLPIPSTIILTNGEINLAGDLTINGSGSTILTIDGNNATRIFYIVTGTVSISGMELTNGRATDYSGGAILNQTGTVFLDDLIVTQNTVDSPFFHGGGGIFNFAAMTITNSQITNNSAPYGGGIYSSYGTTLNMTNVTVNGNQATAVIGQGGGILLSSQPDFPSTINLDGVVVSGNTSTGSAGGVEIASDAVVSIKNSSISGNTAQAGSGGGLAIYANANVTIGNSTINVNQSTEDGGGIWLTEASLTMTDSTISLNTTNDEGGGILSFGTSTLTLTRVTVYNNSAGRGGGLSSYGTTTLANATISGNSASIQAGGVENIGTMNLNHVTLAGNSAVNHSGGISTNQDSVLNFKSSIIADNISPSPSDCNGNFNSQGYNLIEDVDPLNCFISGDTGTNITGLDPMLDTLSDNGGSTLTMNLLPASPAIDSADNTICLPEDQRNFLRGQDGNGDDVNECDMGAVEYAPYPVPYSITRADPNPTSASQVHYTVKFSEPVSNVDLGDFDIMVGGSITGASLASVTGSGLEYIVTVNTGSGDGSIQLELIDDDSILSSFSGDPLGGPGAGNGSALGETYTVIKSPTFADVPANHWAWQYVERLYSAGITGGCGNGNYCPNNTVTRAQMAVFLLRGIHGSAYTPPAATGTMFTDVPASLSTAAWIEQLANEGITSGCGGGNYCPNNSVTRAQMAIFLLRAEHGSAYTPPPATGTMFGDVPASLSTAAWIEQLANEGITSGCSGGNYCPNNPVTRASMAVFLVRTFNLP